MPVCDILHTGIHNFTACSSPTIISQLFWNGMSPRLLNKSLLLFLLILSMRFPCIIPYRNATVTAWGESQPLIRASNTNHEGLLLIIFFSARNNSCLILLCFIQFSITRRVSFMPSGHFSHNCFLISEDPPMYASVNSR